MIQWTENKNEIFVNNEYCIAGGNLAFIEDVSRQQSIQSVVFCVPVECEDNTYWKNSNRTNSVLFDIPHAQKVLMGYPGSMRVWDNVENWRSHIRDDCHGFEIIIPVATSHVNGFATVS